MNNNLIIIFIIIRCTLTSRTIAGNRAILIESEEDELKNQFNVRVRCEIQGVGVLHEEYLYYVR